MDKAPDAYRTISEVAEDLDIAQHVLRFWETRFPQIKPLKRGGGRRYYRPDDVELIKGIRHFLYKEGYTIKGVQRILKEQGPRAVQSVMKTPVPQDWSTEQETTQRVPNERVAQSLPEHAMRHHQESPIFQQDVSNVAPPSLPLAMPAPSQPVMRRDAMLPGFNDAGMTRQAPVPARMGSIPPRPMAIVQPEPLHIASHFSAGGPDAVQGSASHSPSTSFASSTDHISPMHPEPAPYRGQVSMFRGGVQAIQARQLAHDNEMLVDQPVLARSEHTQMRAAHSPVAAFSRAILVDALRDLEECRSIIETVLSHRVME